MDDMDGASSYGADHPDSPAQSRRGLNLARPRRS